MSDRITIDPAVCHGKPCIRGLRYPVENVLEWLASGMSTDEILSDYEDLEREDILAALSYAKSSKNTGFFFAAAAGTLGDNFLDDITDSDLGKDAPRRNLN